MTRSELVADLILEAEAEIEDRFSRYRAEFIARDGLADGDRGILIAEHAREWLAARGRGKGRK